jgi:hypothetical protein
MAAEPELPACGGGWSPADSTLQEEQLASTSYRVAADAVIRASAELPAGAVTPAGAALVRLDAKAGFTLRSCAEELKDTTLSEGIDHWLSQLRRRRPSYGQIGQARRDPVLTHERAGSQHGDKPDT